MPISSLAKNISWATTVFRLFFVNDLLYHIEVILASDSIGGVILPALLCDTIASLGFHFV